MTAPRPTSVRWAALALRVALAAAFLSAVADRFGLWGPAGTPGVAWGGMEAFLAYTGELLWYLPDPLVRFAGWTATVLEVALAIGLLTGVRLREVAGASGLLLTSFALAMTTAYGAEPALSYSVWTAAAASFLLATLPGGSECASPREPPAT